MSVSDIAPGQKVAKRYLLQKEIASGQVNSVMLAMDLETDKQVVVKFIKLEKLDAENARRFRRQLKIVRSLSHPNLLDFLDSGSLKNSLYVVMDYCPKGTLLENLERFHTEGSDLIEIMLAIARGLDCLHSQNIVHRDIKSTNVLVGEDDTLKLADFEIAAWSTEDIMATRSLGTPAVLAPELWQGAEPLISSDIYSLGVLFYEIVTLQLPFYGNNTASLAQGHLFEIPKSPRELADCSVELESLIGQMLVKEPRLRPQSAGEVVKKLEQIKQGSPKREAREGITPSKKVFWGIVLPPCTVFIVCVLALSVLDATRKPNTEKALSFFYLKSPKVYLIRRYTKVKSDTDKTSEDGSPEWNSTIAKDEFSVIEEGEKVLWRRRRLSDNDRIIRRLEFIAPENTKCGKILNDCSLVDSKGELWIPSIPGAYKQESSFPLYEWIVSKSAPITRYAELHYFKNVPKPLNSWLEKVNESPDEFRHSKVASMIPVAEHLVLRRYSECKGTEHLYVERFKNICNRFNDFLYAKDSQGEVLGEIMTISGNIVGDYQKRKFQIEDVSVAVGTAEDSGSM